MTRRVVMIGSGAYWLVSACSTHSIYVACVHLRWSVSHLTSTNMAPYIEPLADDVSTSASMTQDVSDESKTACTYEPVAIIGCGMRLPGNVDSADALFALLDEKREGRCRVPPDRYNVEAFYAGNKNGHVGTEHG